MGYEPSEGRLHDLTPWGSIPLEEVTATATGPGGGGADTALTDAVPAGEEWLILHAYSTHNDGTGAIDIENVGVYSGSDVYLYGISEQGVTVNNHAASAGDIKDIFNGIATPINDMAIKTDYIAIAGDKLGAHYGANVAITATETLTATFRVKKRKIR